MRRGDGDGQSAPQGGAGGAGGADTDKLIPVDTSVLPKLTRTNVLRSGTSLHAAMHTDATPRLAQAPCRNAPHTHTPWPKGANI